MTGFLKTAQSDLFIERQKQKALKVLSIDPGTQITEEDVRKKFQEQVRLEHPDSHIAKVGGLPRNLDELRRAKNFLIKYLRNADD